MDKFYREREYEYNDCTSCNSIHSLSTIATVSANTSQINSNIPNFQNIQIPVPIIHQTHIQPPQPLPSSAQLSQVASIPQLNGLEYNQGEKFLGRIGVKIIEAQIFDSSTHCESSKYLLKVQYVNQIKMTNPLYLNMNNTIRWNQILMFNKIKDGAEILLELLQMNENQVFSFGKRRIFLSEVTNLSFECFGILGEKNVSKGTILLCFYLNQSLPQSQSQLNVSGAMQPQYSHCLPRSQTSTANNSFQNSNPTSCSTSIMSGASQPHRSRINTSTETLAKCRRKTLHQNSQAQLSPIAKSILNKFNYDFQNGTKHQKPTLRLIKHVPSDQPNWMEHSQSSKENIDPRKGHPQKIRIPRNQKTNKDETNILGNISNLQIDLPEKEEDFEETEIPDEDMDESSTQNRQVPEFQISTNLKEKKECIKTPLRSNQMNNLHKKEIEKRILEFYKKKIQFKKEKVSFYKELQSYLSIPSIAQKLRNSTQKTEKKIVSHGMRKLSPKIEKKMLDSSHSSQDILADIEKIESPLVNPSFMKKQRSLNYLDASHANDAHSQANSNFLFSNMPTQKIDGKPKIGNTKKNIKKMIQNEICITPNGAINQQYPTSAIMELSPYMNSVLLNNQSNFDQKNLTLLNPKLNQLYGNLENTIGETTARKNGSKRNKKKLKFQIQTQIPSKTKFNYNFNYNYNFHDCNNTNPNISHSSSLLKLTDSCSYSLTEESPGNTSTSSLSSQNQNSSGIPYQFPKGPRVSPIISPMMSSNRKGKQNKKSQHSNKILFDNGNQKWIIGSKNPGSIKKLSVLRNLNYY